MSHKIRSVMPVTPMRSLRVRLFGIWLSSQPRRSKPMFCVQEAPVKVIVALSTRLQAA